MSNIFVEASTCVLYYRKLGDEWSVENHVMKVIEAFTCLKYGYKDESSVDTVREIMLRKMVGEDERMTLCSKVDLSRLPPSKASLTPHIQRVNHHLATLKRATEAEFWCPKPYDDNQGWRKTEAGLLLVNRTNPTNLSGRSH